MAEWLKALHLKCKEGDFRRFESYPTRKVVEIDKGKNGERVDHSKNKRWDKKERGKNISIPVPEYSVCNGKPMQRGIQQKKVVRKVRRSFKRKEGGGWRGQLG